MLFLKTVWLLVSSNTCSTHQVYWCD